MDNILAIALIINLIIVIGQVIQNNRLRTKLNQAEKVIDYLEPKATSSRLHRFWHFLSQNAEIRINSDKETRSGLINKFETLWEEN